MSALPTMTVEEYFRFEESSPVKHEYVGGRCTRCPTSPCDTTVLPATSSSGCWAEELLLQVWRVSAAAQKGYL